MEQTGDSFETPSRPVRRLLLFVVLLAIATASFRAPAQVAVEDFQQLSADASAARLHGNIQRAIQLYARAIHANPQWKEGWWYLGSMQYATNSYAPAITAFTHYVDLVPKDGVALALRGLCEFEQAEYPQSLQDLQQGITLGAASQPRNAAIIFYHEALLLTRSGRYDEALEKYAAILTHGVAANDQIISGVGLAALRRPLLPKELDPARSSLVSLVGKAAVDLMMGNTDAGRQGFQAVFLRYPKTLNVHYAYGYLSLSDSDLAIAQFKLELSLAPSSAIAHSMLAWVLGMKGDYAAALPNARMAVDEDPSLPIAQLVMGRDLVEVGDVKGAMPHLQAVLKKDPKDLEAHLALVRVYTKLGRKQDARRERLLCLALSGPGTAADANM